LVTIREITIAIRDVLSLMPPNMYASKGIMSDTLNRYKKCDIKEITQAKQAVKDYPQRRKDTPL
jgi:hypothetical protein